MSNNREKKPKIVSAAWICGGMSILGGLLAALSGLFFAFIGAILSIIAIVKYKESKKVLIPWIIGLAISILFLIIFSFVGPIPKPV